MALSAAERADLAAAVARDGWAVTPPVVPQLAVDRLVAELAATTGGAARAGVRDLFDRSPAVRDLAISPAVRSVAEPVLGLACFAVRAIVVDGSPGANRQATWHQELTIAVRERASVAGYGPWSAKDGAAHVQPPAELLERMLAVRVHLDDCGPANGPLRVLPGSHRVGRLSASAIDAWRGGAEAVDCLAERGAILVVRPLLLRASRPATAAAHRRVVHLEFAAEELPAPLDWHARVA